MATMFDQQQGPTPVIDSIANQVLNNIYKYLQTQLGNSSATADAIEDLAEEQKSENKKRDSARRKSETNNRAVQSALGGISKSQSLDLKNSNLANRNRAVQSALLGKINKTGEKSLAAENKNRAVQGALFGKVNNNISKTNQGLDKLKNGIKDAFKSLTSFLTPFVNKSLSHYTNMAKMMRMQNLTAAEKQQIGMSADQSFLDTKSMFGINVAKEDISKFYEELVAGGKDLALMSREQKAAYAALRQSGIDDAKAFSLAMNGEQATIQKMVRAAADPKTKNIIAQTVNGLEDYQIASGGLNNNLKNIINTSQATAKNFNMTSVAMGKSSEFTKNAVLAQSGQFESVSGEFAALAKGVGGSGADMINRIGESAKNTTDAQRRALGSQGGMLQDFANIAADMDMAKKSGAATTVNLRNDKQNAAALADNTKDGKLQDIIDTAFTKVNLATGGTLTALGNTLDKWLGDSADMAGLVRNGFKLVTLTLKTIAFNTGFFGKALLGLGGAAAVVAIVANWDKIKPKLAEMFPKIKSAVSGALKNLAPFVSDIISGIKKAFSDLFSGGIGGLFGGGSSDGKSKVSSMASSIGPVAKNLAGSIGDGLKQALPSLGGILFDIFSGLGDLLSGLLGAGGTLISGIVTALGDFISKALPPLTDLVNVIVNGVNTALWLIVPALENIIVKAIDGLVKIMEVIAPSIPSICDVLNTLISVGIPAIQSIVETLIPYIPPILDCINEIVKTVVPVIKTLIEQISSIIQTLIRGIRDIVDTLIKSITSIANNIVTSIKEVILTTINAIKDILIEYKPVFENIVNIIGKIVDVALPIIENIVAPALDMLVKQALPIILDILDLLWNEVAKPLFDTITWFFTQKLPAIFSSITDVLSKGFDLVVSWVNAGVDLVKNMPEMIYNKIMQWYYGFLGWFKEKLADILDMIARIGPDNEDMIAKAAKMKSDAASDTARAEGFEKANEDLVNKILEPTRDAQAAFDKAVNNFGKTDQTLAEYREQKEAERDARRADREARANGDSQASFSIVQKSLFTITGLLTSAVNNVPSILSTIAEILSVAGKNIINHLSSISDGVYNIFMTTSAGEAMLGSVNSVEYMEKIANYTGSKLQLQPFAEGGVVSKATPALIGEAGKEAVIPMSSYDKMKSTVSKLTSSEQSLLSKATNDAMDNAEYNAAVEALNKWQGGRMKPAEFFAMFGPIAREDMRTTGIPASVTLAQAALESGWGKTAKAEFKNLFGIKGKGNAGSAVVNTHEVYDGVRVQKKDAFAQYLSYLDSITAHSDYLLNAKRKKGVDGLRYGEALMHIFEPNLFAYLLREGGYATSTAYGKKLVNLMKGHNLYKWDVSSLSLKNVGGTQANLISKAKANLANQTASNERMSQLLNEEYQREVERAAKEGKAAPTAMANFTTGAIAGSAQVAAQTAEAVASNSTAAMMASLAAEQTSALEVAEKDYSNLSKLPDSTPLEQMKYLSNKAMDAVIKTTRGEDYYVTSKIAKHAGESNDSSEILAALLEITRYMRAIVNKRNTPAAARPAPAKF